MNDLMMAMMAAKAVGGSGSGGIRGANGLSAYELYVRQGGTLSLTEWLSKPSAGAPAYAESLDWLNANGDQSKIYLLPDGYLYAKTYTTKPNFTNLFDPSQALLNKKRTGKTLGEALETTDLPGAFTSAPLKPIQCKEGDVATKIRIRGVTLRTWKSSDELITYCDAAGTYRQRIPFKNGIYQVEDNGDLTISAGWVSSGPIAGCADNYKQFCVTAYPYSSETAITAADIANIIVTVDEEITYSTGLQWVNTGIKYANYALTDSDRKGIAALAKGGSPLAGKKVLVLGDSVSADAYGNYAKWVTVLRDEGFFPSDVLNNSQHATGFVARYTGDSADAQNDFIDRITAVTDKSSYDLVVVFGGINDYIQSIPLGGGTGETDRDTYFKPAVDYFFTYLIQNFTQARIAVLSPLRTYNVYKNTAGVYQTAYADYIRSVAKSYCLPVLNLTEESGFCPFVETFRNRWTLIPSGYTSADGVHPNREYQQQYLAPLIKGFLQGLYAGEA